MISDPWGVLSESSIQASRAGAQYLSHGVVGWVFAKILSTSSAALKKEFPYPILFDILPPRT
jgi:hypothetical protein